MTSGQYRRRIGQRTMSSSRERLDMENDAKRSITFERGAGAFLSRRSLAWLGVLFVASVVAVGLLVYYLAPCRGVPADGSALIAGGGDGKTAVTEQPTTISPETDLELRLPHDLRPISYALRLQPFIVEGNFTFDAHVDVRIECRTPTKRIILHGVELDISKESLKLTDSEGKSLAIAYPTVDKKREFLIFNLDEELKNGHMYTLSMDYIGKLAETLAGFYRSKYEDKWIATTQFQATDARRAFPCFDEPGFKAVFNVTLIRSGEMTSLSNMPVSNSNVMSDGWVKDQFLPTKNMSTYLLAFVVSDFAYKEDNSSRVRFRVYARKDAINQSDYALKTGPKVLRYYEEFFNVSYPLPKQDMIAIPDFGAGAMENWGLITYRETALLFDPQISGSKSRQRIAIVIAHEIAHQWFGDLVTPLWWEDLWLNEGFASYVEYLGVNEVHPQWKMLDQFIVEDLHDVFEMDSLKTSHPVSVPVDNPDQIAEIFDEISYAKGASLLRMMHYYLGDDVFRAGVKNYLIDKQYDNAVQDELWDHLTKAAVASGKKDINVKTIMDTWTVQIGYPVVYAKRNSDKTITLNQTRFLLIQNDTAVDNTKWEIPITFTTGSSPDFNNTNPVAWMHKDGEPVTLSKGVSDASVWLIINIQETGFYRVNYENENWKLIIEQLNTNHLVIHPLNRAQVINDAFNLARAGLLSYDIALSTTQYLTKETEFVPFKAALETVQYVDSMLSKTGSYGKWKKYLLSLVKPLYNNLKFDDQQHVTEDDWKDAEHLPSLTRAMAVKLACELDMKECLNASASAFSQWKDLNRSISANLRAAVICTVLQQGDIEEWEFVWSQYLTSNVGSEKATYLATLGCTAKPWILAKYLDMALTSKKIRAQDMASIIASVAMNDVGRFLAYNFVRDRWQQLREKFKSGSFTLARILKASMKNLNTPFELEELHWFKNIYKDNLGPAERAMSQIIEETEANIHWMNTNYKIIEEWLNKQTIATT